MEYASKNMMTREPLADDTAQEIVTTDLRRDNDNSELVSGWFASIKRLQRLISWIIYLIGWTEMDDHVIGYARFNYPELFICSQ